MHIFHVVDKSLKGSNINQFINELNEKTINNTIVIGLKNIINYFVLLKRPVIHIHGLPKILLIIRILKIFNKKIITTLYLETIKQNNICINGNKIQNRCKRFDKAVKYSDLVIINEEEILKYVKSYKDVFIYQSIGIFHENEIKSQDVQLKFNATIYTESDINEKSNLHILIECMRYMPPDYVLVCRYNESDQNYLKHLNALSVNLSVENQISFIKNDEDAVAYDYFVTDSLILNNYNSVFENLLKYRPVLIYNSDKNSNSDFGLSHIKSKAPKTIAHNIRRNINNYNGIEGESIKNYSFEFCSNQYITHYKK